MAKPRILSAWFMRKWSKKTDEDDGSFNGVKLRSVERVPPFRRKRTFIREIWSGEGGSGAWAEMMTCHSNAGGKDFFLGFRYRQECICLLAVIRL